MAVSSQRPSQDLHASGVGGVYKEQEGKQNKESRERGCGCAGRVLAGLDVDL